MYSAQYFVVPSRNLCRDSQSTIVLARAYPVDLVRTHKHHALMRALGSSRVSAPNNTEAVYQVGLVRPAPGL